MKTQTRGGCLHNSPFSTDLVISFDAEKKSTSHFCRARQGPEALAFLRFESLGGGDAGGGTAAPAVLSPLDDVAAGTGAPLDPAPRVALESHVAPAASGLHLLEDVDVCHRAPSLAGRTLLWTLRKGGVNNCFVFKLLRQPDL